MLDTTSKCIYIYIYIISFLLIIGLSIRYSNGLLQVIPNKRDIAPETGHDELSAACKLKVDMEQLLMILIIKIQIFVRLF